MSLREEFETICDNLQKEADEKCDKETRSVQAYWNGYKQGCEDFFKCVRRIEIQE